MAGLPGQTTARILSHLFLFATLLAGQSGFAAAHPARGGNTAYIRVNQVGYVGSSTKRAYLMASAAETGATFAVKNSSGTTVYSASIGANLGTWSTSYPDVYALDFDAVTTPGTYTIVTSGPIAGSSPTFTIDTATNVYTGGLSNALSFYQNERDGPNYIPSALRTAP